MPLIQANGVRLYTQTLGTEGPPVVMVHGLLLGNISTWFFNVGPALARDHRVICYDMRGHGLSERPPTGYTLETMSADLHAVVTQVAGEPVSLVGHSYGGSLVLRYAIDHPEMVKRLVLVEAPVPSISEEYEILTWGKSVSHIAAEHRGEDIIKGMTEEARQEIFGRMPPGMRAAMLRAGKRPNLLLKQMLGLMSSTTMADDVMNEPPIPTEAIAGVTCPVLLCYGRYSGMHPGQDHVLRTALKRSRLATLSGGHALPLDATEELTAAIRPFLSEAVPAK